MPLLSIDKIKPLMVLSDNLHDRTGRLLAVKGTVITEKHFLVFKTWGIKEVAILDDKNEVLEENYPPEEVMNQINDVIEELKPQFFHNNLDHPFIIELLRLVAQKKVASNDA